MQRAIATAIFVGGTKVQLQAEGVGALRRGFQELGPLDRMRMGANYLTRIPVTDWDNVFCATLKKAYGLPAAPGALSAFWKAIPKDVQDAFRRLFLVRELTEVLGRDTDRHAYWTGWVDELVDVQRGFAGQTEYAVLRFKGFAVIEFFEVGNAAYFYSDTELRDVLAQTIRSPRDLKEPTGSNRLIHSSGWQSYATQMVGSFMRRTRR